jgi:hypothetical protein
MSRLNCPDSTAYFELQEVSDLSHLCILVEKEEADILIWQQQYLIHTVI